MAEWSVRRTRNPAVSGVRILLQRIAGVALGCLEFKSSPTLVHVNSQVAASYQLGFLILLCCI